MEITLIVRVTSSACNVASAEAPEQEDTDDSNNRDERCIVIAAPGVHADLELTKSAAPDPVRVGDTLTYTLTVTNQGPVAATGITVTDTLPPSFKLDGINSTCGVTRNTSGAVVSLEVPPLGNGASCDVTISVIPTRLGTFTNEAAVVGDQPDLVAVNNQRNVDTTVICSLPTATGGGGYVLAYMEAFSGHEQVLRSSDGVTWNTLGGRGISLALGAASCGGGFPILTFAQDTAWQLRVRSNADLSPHGWSPADIAPPLNQFISAPSVAYAGDSKFLVAFRSGGAVVVRALDLNANSWLPSDLAPTDPANNNVWDRPTIAIMGQRVALAWRTSRVGLPSIAVGNLNFPGITWTNIYTFNLNELGYTDAVDDALLAQDGTAFYLGMTRDEKGPFMGAFGKASFFVYRSIDGVAWSPLPRIEGIVPGGHSTAMAARSTGDMLVAIIYSARSQLVGNVYRFQGGQRKWGQRSENGVRS